MKMLMLNKKEEDVLPVKTGVEETEAVRVRVLIPDQVPVQDRGTNPARGKAAAQEEDVSSDEGFKNSSILCL